MSDLHALNGKAATGSYRAYKDFQGTCSKICGLQVGHADLEIDFFDLTPSPMLSFGQRMPLEWKP